MPAETRRVEMRHGNSLFIATAARVSTVEEAKAFLRSTREEMPDATHHVHAMKIGHGASVTEGVSDDGEPAGTSGPPILAILRGSELGDTIIVVTRYFGGTKLGTGGLVTAYGNAARLVLDGLKTIEKVDRVPLRIECDYGHFERLRRMLPEFEALVEHEEFGATVVILLRVPSERLDALAAAVNDATAGQAKLQTPADQPPP